MPVWFPVLVAVLVVAQLAVMLLLLARARRPATAVDPTLHGAVERVERAVREEIARNRDEASTTARDLRGELAASLNTVSSALLKRLTEAGQLQQGQLDSFAASLQALVSNNDARFETIRGTLDRKLAEGHAAAEHHAAHNREAAATAMNGSTNLLLARLTDAATFQASQLDTFAATLAALTRSNNQQLDQVRETVERKLSALQADNAAKLEQMRATVDEKLHATLEARLGESFKLVGDRLEQVHKGLGEMQTLAHGVGDLKRVLTNVKTRGNWGEVQLGNLLEQMLTPDQYATNVAVNPDSAERVEFAIRLPGHGTPLWLPLDAKFPQEDFQRLVDAADAGDADGIARHAAALEARVCAEAKKIRDKYICAPHTTDFAILFLPTESLFAEVLRRPGLCDGVLHDHRVILAGPTTLSAVLSSLQMGFRTLVLEKRSSEVWQVLGAVKTEFAKFGTVLAKVQKKLLDASNTMDAAAVRTRAMERTLRSVEQSPGEAPLALPLFDDLSELAPAD